MDVADESAFRLVYGPVSQHVVIRRPEWVAGTFERPEVGVFTQTHTRRHPVPWGRLAVGERVWMKWAGGPMVATATVKDFEEIASCTPGTLRRAVVGYRLHDLKQYWASLPPAFDAVAIFLSNEEWLPKPGEPVLPRHRESWLVLPDDFRIHFHAPAPGIRQAITVTLRFAVFRRDSFTCHYCGRRAPEVVLHVDHVRPVKEGGTNDFDNLTTACQDCNLGKGAKLLPQAPRPKEADS